MSRFAAELTTTVDHNVRQPANLTVVEFVFQPFTVTVLAPSAFARGRVAQQTACPTRHPQLMRQDLITPLVLVGDVLGTRAAQPDVPSALPLGCRRAWNQVKDEIAIIISTSLAPIQT